MPDASQLTPAYFKIQSERVASAREKIAGRPATVSNGRQIPTDGSLPIGVGRRLDASVMFLDISGFSNRPSETVSDQENLLRILSFFFTEMIRIVEDYGGVVEKNTGDGLMAYFVRDSTPTTEQHRALAAALTMFHATTYLINPVIRASNIDELDFRICIDHGPITVAEVGAAQRFHGIVAIGTTANIASKMLSHAAPNTILLGANQCNGIPVSWRNNYLEIETLDTGWVYTKTNNPYPFYRYNGRWKTSPS